jgi:AraC family transcriptional regulator, regulatory protein of adaptative response / methylated-DNA-[protein]-cysteine methyltransferase
MVKERQRRGTSFCRRIIYAFCVDNYPYRNLSTLWVSKIAEIAYDVFYCVNNMNTISYRFSSFPFGEILIATTNGKLCAIAFVVDRGRGACLDAVKKQWPGYEFILDNRAVKKYVDLIENGGAIRADDVEWRGTSFQIKVWKALLRIPRGKCVSYTQVAAMIGKPKAVRAVGNAVGKNPIAVLVPCHRVIRSSGALGGYYWGVAMKKKLLDREA